MLTQKRYGLAIFGAGATLLDGGESGFTCALKPEKKAQDPRAFVEGQEVAITDDIISAC